MTNHLTLLSALTKFRHFAGRHSKKTIIFALLIVVCMLGLSVGIMQRFTASAAVAPNVAVAASSSDANTPLQTITYSGTVTTAGTLTAVNMQVPAGSTVGNLRSTSGTLRVHPTDSRYIQWLPKAPINVAVGARIVIPAQGIYFGPAGTYQLGFRVVGSGSTPTLSAGSASLTLTDRTTACPTSWPSTTQENAKPGEPNWRIQSSAYNGTVFSAYADRESVECGNRLYLKIDSAASRNVKLSVLRMGYYNGDGARKIWETTGNFVGGDQAAPKILNGTNTAKPDNMASASHWWYNVGIRIDGAYSPGTYLIKLDDQVGHQTYVPFTVRDKTSTKHEFMLQQANTTWQAYNGFGGKSFYTASGGSARLTFQRPYNGDFGAGQFLSLEYGLVYWMEKQGYDVSYWTDMDLHRYGSTLSARAKTLILPAHDEYYSATMKSGIKAGISRNTNLVSFGANQMFRQIIPDTSGQVFEVFERWTKWPDSTTFRYRGYQHHEQAILGAEYGCRSDGTVTTNGSWLWKGVPVGTQIPGFANGETDWSHPSSQAPVPAGLQILTSAPLDFCATSDPKRMDIVAYTAPSGAKVFGGSTFGYSCFLIAQCPANWKSKGAPLVVTPQSSAVVQQAVTNVYEWTNGPLAP